MSETTTITPGFDPAAITPELVDGLDKAQLRDVLAHHQVPEQPKSASKGHLQTLVRMALAAHAPPAALESGETPPELSPAEAAAEVQAIVENAPASVVPAASRWQLILQMAEVTAKSNLCPKDLKGKPADVALIYLKANDLGVPLTSALDQLYVVHGKVGMEAKMMRALVRRDHHSIQTVETDRFHALVHGRRGDEPYDEDDGYFDLDDAVDQGLIRSWHWDGEGEARRPVVVAADGKPMWRSDPRLMCLERATSRLSRQLFSDCLAGVSYTPDELGFIDVEPADGTPADPEAATVSLDQQRSDIAARIAELPDDLKAKLRAEWMKRNLPGPADLRPAALRTALNLLEPIESEAVVRKAQHDATIEDADVVESSDDVAAAAADNEQQERDGASLPAEPVPPEDAVTICPGCSKPIGDDDPAVFSDADVPYHAECAPFV